jgi:hypothetical protein
MRRDGESGAVEVSSVGKPTGRSAANLAVPPKGGGIFLKVGVRIVINISMGDY